MKKRDGKRRRVDDAPTAITPLPDQWRPIIRALADAQAETERRAMRWVEAMAANIRSKLTPGR